MKHYFSNLVTRSSLSIRGTESPVPQITRLRGVAPIETEDFIIQEQPTPRNRAEARVYREQRPALPEKDRQILFTSKAAQGLTAETGEHPEGQAARIQDFKDPLQGNYHPPQVNGREHHLENMQPFGDNEPATTRQAKSNEPKQEHSTEEPGNSDTFDTFRLETNNSTPQMKKEKSVEFTETVKELQAWVNETVELQEEIPAPGVRSSYQVLTEPAESKEKQDTGSMVPTREPPDPFTPESVIGCPESLNLSIGAINLVVEADRSETSVGQGQPPQQEKQTGKSAEKKPNSSRLQRLYIS